MEMLTGSNRDIARAAAALTKGALVAFPTETVYGLGGDAFNVTALARIFEVKDRPRFDPLIIHIADLDTLDRLVLWEALGKEAVEKFRLLSNHFWPGPLTLILPKKKEVPDLATSGLGTAAIRFPDCDIAQKLIRLSAGAVAAPSANPFGCLSPTRAEHVRSQLGEKVDFIIDGGRTSVGLESTVLDIGCEPCCILRPGGLGREQIESLIGKVEIQSSAPGGDQGPAQISPGQLKSHYAPLTPLYLYPNGQLAFLPESPDEGRLFFSAPEIMLSERSRVLSPGGDPTEAAANFFDMLHDLDSMGLKAIRAEEAPPRFLGLAINDRLRRAAK